MFRYSLLANCGQLSYNTSLVSPYLNTQCDANALTTSRPVVRFSWTTRVSLFNQSAMTKMNRFPAFVFGNGHNPSTATDSSGCFAWNKRICCLRRMIRKRFRAQWGQDRTLEAISAGINNITSGGCVQTSASGWADLPSSNDE